MKYNQKEGCGEQRRVCNAFFAVRLERWMRFRGVVYIGEERYDINICFEVISSERKNLYNIKREVMKNG